MLDRLDAALSSLAETVDSIDPRQDTLAYAQHVATAVRSPSPSTTTARPRSPSLLVGGSVSSPLAPVEGGAEGGAVDEALALKARIAPGIEHMEKCIKTLRAMCHWCVCVWMLFGWSHMYVCL